MYLLSLIALIYFISCERSVSHPLYVEGGGVFDAENNFYKTVVIGNQEWMAENLKTDLFCNGDSIPYSGTDIRVKVYDNDPANEAVYGKLYNFQAALDTSGLCPCGWHMPTELEYAVLINYLGGLYEAMKKMKSTGTLNKGTGLWIEQGPSGNIYYGSNASGFNALPAGHAGSSVSFSNRDTLAVFWALPEKGTDAIMFRMGNNPYVEKVSYKQPYTKKNYYHSIRCIKTL